MIFRLVSSKQLFRYIVRFSVNSRWAVHLWICEVRSHLFVPGAPIHAKNLFCAQCPQWTPIPRGLPWQNCGLIRSILLRLFQTPTFSNDIVPAMRPILHINCLSIDIHYLTRYKHFFFLSVSYYFKLTIQYLIHIFTRWNCIALSKQESQ